MWRYEYLYVPFTVVADTQIYLIFLFSPVPACCDLLPLKFSFVLIWATVKHLCTVSPDLGGYVCYQFSLQ